MHLAKLLQLGTFPKKVSNVTTQKDLKEIKNTWEKLMEKQRTNIDLLHGNKSLVTFLSVKRSIITDVISQYFGDSKKE